VSLEAKSERRNWKINMDRQFGVSLL